MKKWIIISAIAGGIGAAGCGGAGVYADDDPGDGDTAFKAGYDANIRQGEFDADIGISEEDPPQQPQPDVIPDE